MLICSNCNSFHAHPTTICELQSLSHLFQTMATNIEQYNNQTINSNLTNPRFTKNMQIMTNVWLSAKAEVDQRLRILKQNVETLKEIT